MFFHNYLMLHLLGGTIYQNLKLLLLCTFDINCLERKRYSYLKIKLFKTYSLMHYILHNVSFLRMNIKTVLKSPRYIQSGRYTDKRPITFKAYRRLEI